MSALLLNFRNMMIVSLILAVIMIIGFGVHSDNHFNIVFWQALFRWIHVFFGILWIGLLYYFNFVQTRKMPDIPNELKPAISKYIAPEALFWFRWAALGTVLAGICLLILKSYVVPNYFWEVITFGLAGGFVPGNGGDVKYVLMGTGVWMAIIMFVNVWGIIWPKQKIVLGMVEADADAKAKAGRIATLASRVNTLLSLPMLTAMTMYQTLFS